MRILLTGISGHLGRIIGAHLAGRGHEVIGVSRHPAGAPAGVSVLSADLGTEEADERLAEQPRFEAIVHGAASLACAPDDISLSITNGAGTQQMVALARRWEVESLVFVSSLPVIGPPTELPILETHPAAPTTAYHASKLYGEHLVALAAGAGTPAVSLRLSAPAGPGMPRGKILSTFVERALVGAPLQVAGRGTRAQDYVDTRDIAAAVEGALGHRASGVLNIASGTCITNLDLARLCVEVLDSRSEIEAAGAADPRDGERWEVSIEQATATIGYRPRHSLTASILALADELR